MSAVESQVTVTVRGTAGNEERRPLRFLQGEPLLRFFLHALLRFAFESAAWAVPLAPCAAGESMRRHAQANAMITATRNLRPPTRVKDIDGTVRLASLPGIGTCPHRERGFSPRTSVQRGSPPP